MPNLTNAIEWAITECNKPDVGYSQDYRNQQTVNGITYYDCSSFIWFALAAGGFDVVGAHGGDTWPITTAYMSGWLSNLGFVEQSLSGEWKSGDVLLRDGHTEMVYSGGTASGISMGAHTDGIALADQVSINQGVTTAGEWGSLWRYPVKTGISAYVVAAICGNWWQESNINPGIYESLIVTPLADNSVYGGYGLGQWTNAPSLGLTRRTALANWLSANGYSVTDPAGQWAFLQAENVWYNRGYGADYSSLSDFLNTSNTDLTELTYAFMQGWEGIWDGTQDNRVAWANQCYNYILAHETDPNITEWVIGNRYLSEAERLNNAVMLYRMIGGESPGPGPQPPFPPHPPKTRTGLPIWMLCRRTKFALIK